MHLRRDSVGEGWLQQLLNDRWWRRGIHNGKLTPAAEP
jgi:hypothetical protein